MSYKIYTTDGVFIEETNLIPDNFTGFFKYSSVTSTYWYKEWFLNDKLHRIDGPAIEYENGTKYWYIDGKLHRFDGPAVEFYDGRKHWYVDGEQITELQFKLLHDMMKLKNLL